MRIDIYQDGSCNNHATLRSMGLGVAVFVDGNYEEDFSRAIGVEPALLNSSNIAEWMACVEAMKIAKQLIEIYPHAQLYIFSDSQIITNQYNGTYRILHEEFRKHYTEARKYGIEAGIREITWVPRKKNQKADKLSKEGLQLVSLPKVA